MNPTQLLKAWKHTAPVDHSALDAIGYASSNVVVHHTGQIFAIGCCYETTDAGENAGCVDLFECHAMGWHPLLRLTASNARAQAFFGYSLVMSADGALLCVGALGAKSSIVEDRAASGAVYIFQKTAKGWVETHILRPIMAETGDGFGSALALNAAGTRLIIGACRESVGQEKGVGAVYVFERVDTAWTQRTRIVPITETQVRYFGVDVGITPAGDYIAVQSEDRRDLELENRLYAHGFHQRRNTWVPAHLRQK